jgi:hypothetical protein
VYLKTFSGGRHAVYHSRHPAGMKAFSLDTINMFHTDGQRVRFSL